MNLYQDFASRVKEESIFTQGERIIIAVSGGVDSIVLLDLIERLPEGHKPDVTVAHVNHQFRKESAEEASFVKTLAEKYNVPVHVYTWPKNRHPQTGLESAAREVRYSFFRTLAEERGVNTVLTAHHKDDLVETVLMRFVRGNSIDELTGISSIRRDKELNIVRPLLPYSKSDLLDYAEEQHLRWREDETNKSSDFTRNRFRHTIIPLLKSENPAVEDHIIHFSEEIKSVLALITPIIEEKRKAIIQFGEKGLIIDRRLFIELDQFMQEKVLANAVNEWNDKGPFLLTQKHLMLFRKWIETSGPNASLELPNQLIARRTYDKCTIDKRDEQEMQVTSPESDQKLEVGQWIKLSDNYKLGLQTHSDYLKHVSKDEDRFLFLNIDTTKMPLIIRHRKNGDRMIVKGLNGSKKLKDLFIDQKIPLSKRDQAWVVTDSDGDIIWVIGYKESALSLDPITDTISYVLVYTEDTTNK